MREGNQDSKLNKITFMAVGDIMLDRNVGKIIAARGPEYPFLYTADLFKTADIIFGNLECPISRKGEACTNKPERDPRFRADPIVVKGLKYAGFNVICLANNHTLDYGEEALDDTFSILNKHNIKCLGAGRNLAEASKELIVETKGMKIGFLAYSGTPEAGKNKAGCAPFKNQIIESKIKKIREKVDVIIVSLHWGIEYTCYPSSKEIELAHKIIDWGADLVLGHHPHVLRGIEKYNNGIIVYSLGNFVFDQHNKEIRKEAFDRTLLTKVNGWNFGIGDTKTEESMVFECEFSDKGVESLEIIPILINGTYQPQELQEGEKERVLLKVQNLSRDIPFKAYKIDALGYEYRFYEIRQNPLKLLRKIGKIRPRHLSELSSILSKLRILR